MLIMDIPPYHLVLGSVLYDFTLTIDKLINLA
jgi:hypothetical protein